MLKSVALINYRAHHKLRIELEPLTAIVGPNGAGKSAVLRAIDTVIGDRWPSLASLRQPQDFTDFDTARVLAITVEFATPQLLEPDALGKQAQVNQLRITCRPYKNKGPWGQPGDPNFDFEALDAAGAKPMLCTSVGKGAGPEFRPLLGVTADLRQRVPSVLIDHQRSVAHQMPWTRGSVLQKLLTPASRSPWRCCAARTSRASRRRSTRPPVGP